MFHVGSEVLTEALWRILSYGIERSVAVKVNRLFDCYWLLAWLILWPLRWKFHVPQKGWLTFGLRRVIFQKTEYFILLHVCHSSLFYKGRKAIIMRSHLITETEVTHVNRNQKRNLWFSRRCIWTLTSLEMWRHVILWKFTDVSEDRTAFIFRVARVSRILKQ
jgi:hypothetical protein